METIYIYHHVATDTYWGNDKEWVSKMYNLPIVLGEVEIEKDTLFEVKKILNKDGFVKLNKKDVKRLDYRQGIEIK